MFDLEAYCHDAAARAFDAARTRAALLRSDSAATRERAIFCDCAITAAADCIIAFRAAAIDNVTRTP